MEILKRLTSRKLWVTIVTIGFNVYILFAGEELPEELKIAVLTMIDSVVSVYVIVQGIIDAKK